MLKMVPCSIALLSCVCVRAASAESWNLQAAITEDKLLEVDNLLQAMQTTGKATQTCTKEMFTSHSSLSHFSACSQTGTSNGKGLPWEGRTCSPVKNIHSSVVAALILPILSVGLK